MKTLCILSIQTGSYEDLQKLSQQYQLVLDFMVNHISPESPQFQHYMQYGEESPFASMFIHWSKFWPEGEEVHRHWGHWGY
jgi:sucrose phosphorylase